MTVQHDTQDDLDTPKTKTRIDEFDVDVAEWLNDDSFKLKEGEAIIYNDIDDVSNNDDLGSIETSDRNMNHAVKRDDHNDDEFNALLSAELLLTNELADDFTWKTVIKRAKNNLGQLIWTHHADANLDTKRYIVKMSNGIDSMKRELQHNLIATNMFTQADSEGR